MALSYLQSEQKSKESLKNQACSLQLHVSTSRITAFWPIPRLYETLKLRKAIFSPEMVRKAVPQSSSSKFETHLTIAWGSNLWNFQNVTVSKSIFRVFSMKCSFLHLFKFLKKKFYVQKCQRAKIEITVLKIKAWKMVSLLSLFK